MLIYYVLLPMKVPWECCCLSVLFTTLSIREKVWSVQGVEVVRELSCLDSTSSYWRIVHLLKLLFLHHLGSEWLIRFLWSDDLASQIFHEKRLSFFDERLCFLGWLVEGLLGWTTTRWLGMTRRRGPQSLIFNSWVKDADILINDCLILS
jgi:hypothetical protein